MSCTTTGCPPGKRCFQVGFNEYQCVNTTTPRGGTVLEPNQVFSKAYASIDQLMNEAILGGQPKKKKGTSELDRLIDRADDGKKKKNKRGGEQKEEEEDEEEETTTTKTPAKTNTNTPATITPPSPGTTTTGGGPAKALEWIKANPPFAIIIAGLLLYIVIKGGR